MHEYIPFDIDYSLEYFKVVFFEVPTLVADYIIMFKVEQEHNLLLLFSVQFWIFRVVGKVQHSRFVFGRYIV